MKFKDAIKIILRHEGGLSKDKHDPGGITKYGISKASYPDLDIEHLTKEQAIEIYRERWNKIRCDELPECLRLIVFDAFTCMGYRAIMILQEEVGAKVDGIVGKETLTKIRDYIHKHGCRALLNEYTLDLLGFYNRLKLWWKYGTSWTNRTLECWKISIEELMKDGKKENET